MPDTMFAYRLLFLMVFMTSIMSWVFLWLVGYIQHHPLFHAHPGKPGAVSAMGLLLVLACAVLDFFRVAERNSLLLVLMSVGLVIPWGMVLIIKCHALIRSRKFSSHN
ncbi:hypothetical protein JYG34_16085 [Pseudomonas entomophila]|uniref:hypothetical protein n=1 Tax=Pseudomonas entomophila TaxID=312306 RepID=UPI001BD05933|nr:hypothetical protein [Pseudomonas entomophila]QVM89543.1 hypothetical protein JYG34_16085 [Pseudomonas entomophila]